MWISFLSLFRHLFFYYVHKVPEHSVDFYLYRSKYFEFYSIIFYSHFFSTSQKLHLFFLISKLKFAKSRFGFKIILFYQLKCCKCFTWKGMHRGKQPLTLCLVRMINKFEEIGLFNVKYGRRWKQYVSRNKKKMLLQLWSYQGLQEPLLMHVELLECWIFYCYCSKNLEKNNLILTV